MTVRRILFLLLFFSAGAALAQTSESDFILNAPTLVVPTDAASYLQVVQKKTYSTTCVGTVALGAASCTVANVTGIATSDRIKISAAGASGADLSTVVTGVGGSVITWRDATSAAVSNPSIMPVSMTKKSAFPTSGVADNKLTGCILPDCRTNLGLGTANTPQFKGIGLGIAAPTQGLNILGPGADPGSLVPGGAIVTTLATNLTPTGVIPTFREVTGCVGDNTTFIGCSGRFIAVGDDASVAPGTKGVLYGLQISMQPKIARNNVPFDDVAALIISNDGTFPSIVESIYFGHNTAFGTGPEWGAIVGADANALYGFKLSGHYTNGMEFAAAGANYAAFTGAAMHLGNNIAAITARNATDNADLEIVRLNTSNQIAFGNSPIRTTNSILAGGVITLDNATSLQAKDSGGTTRGLLQMFSNNITYLEGGAGGLIIRTNNTAVQAATVDSAGVFSLGLAGTNGGALNLQGASSGALAIRVAAAASGTLTLPSGTTDFSATAGIVQQASTGAPFTVSNTLTSPPILPGYAIGSLPSGTIGMLAYVTDQSAACPALGVAPTAGGALKCRVWYNGSAWVGD